MREKEIKTYSIAQFCRIDRSNMYKMIKGKRNPSSAESVENMAEYMRLTPLECGQLLEAYQITIMGYDTYHRQKSVQDFLMSFSEGAAKSEKDFLVQNCGTELQKLSGRIYLLMQPEDNFIMNLLVTAGVESKSLEIEHIFCLNNSKDLIMDKRDYNLYCLKDILPMFTQCFCVYRPYCYYDNIVFHSSTFTLMSSMILTSEYATIINYSYFTGISGHSMLRYMQSIIHQISFLSFIQREAVSVSFQTGTITKSQCFYYPQITAERFWKWRRDTGSF